MIKYMIKCRNNWQFFRQEGVFCVPIAIGMGLHSPLHPARLNLVLIRPVVPSPSSLVPFYH